MKKKKNDYHRLMAQSEFARLSSEGTREEILAALHFYVAKKTGRPADPPYIRMRKSRERKRLRLGLPLRRRGGQPRTSNKDAIT